MKLIQLLLCMIVSSNIFNVYSTTIRSALYRNESGHCVGIKGDYHFLGYPLPPGVGASVFQQLEEEQTASFVECLERLKERKNLIILAESQKGPSKSLRGAANTGFQQLLFRIAYLGSNDPELRNYALNKLKIPAFPTNVAVEKADPRTDDLYDFLQIVDLNYASWEYLPVFGSIRKELPEVKFMQAMSDALSTLHGWIAFVKKECPGHPRISSMENIFSQLKAQKNILEKKFGADATLQDFFSAKQKPKVLAEELHNAMLVWRRFYNEAFSNIGFFARVLELKNQETPCIVFAGAAHTYFVEQMLKECGYKKIFEAGNYNTIDIMDEKDQIITVKEKIPAPELLQSILRQKDFDAFCAALHGCIKAPVKVAQP